MNLLIYKKMANVFDFWSMSWVCCVSESFHWKLHRALSMDGLWVFLFHPNKQVDSLYHVNLIKFTTKDPKRTGFAGKKNSWKNPTNYFAGIKLISEHKSPRRIRICFGYLSLLVLIYQKRNHRDDFSRHKQRNLTRFEPYQLHDLESTIPTGLRIFEFILIKDLAFNLNPSWSKNSWLIWVINNYLLDGRNSDGLATYLA